MYSAMSLHGGLALGPKRHARAVNRSNTYQPMSFLRDSDLVFCYLTSNSSQGATAYSLLSLVKKLLLLSNQIRPSHSFDSHEQPLRKRDAEPD